MINAIQRFQWTILSIVFAFLVWAHILPGNSYTLFFAFIIISFLFFQGVKQIGIWAQKYFFKTNLHAFDFPLGLALFALFLSFWVKLSPEIFVPWAFLMCGLIFRFYHFFKNIKYWELALKQAEAFEICLFLSLSGILFWFAPGNGLLSYPNDYDSGMLHVALPKRWDFLNDVKTQIYFRGAFIGNFAHVLYYFFLKVFSGNDLTLKVINFCGFFSFFSIARKLRLQIPEISFWPLIIPFLLVISFETRENLVSTNLDALFLLFFFSGSVALLISTVSMQIEHLIVGTVLLGFSAGLKHFGFLMSAPILTLFYSYHFFFHRQMFRMSAYRWIGFSFVGAILFLLVSLPFYLHNFLAGNNILFPFLGSKVNTYGWTESEIKDFGAIIEVWGHRKDFAGFWTLPWDFVDFPEKYQILITHNIEVYSYSLLFVLSWLALGFGAFLAFKKKPLALLLSVTHLIQLFFWYKGSQVVRYLLPNLAVGILIYIVIVFQFLNLKIENQNRRVIGLMAMIFLSVFAIANLRMPQKLVVISADERQAAVMNSNGANDQAIEYLRSLHISERIFYVSDLSYRQYMIDLEVCGDWFGPCRWGDILKVRALDSHFSIRPKSEIRESLKKNGIGWLVINWKNFFLAQDRPAPMSLAFPDIECFSLEKSFGIVDIFKVNKECLYEN